MNEFHGFFPPGRGEGEVHTVNHSIMRVACLVDKTATPGENTASGFPCEETRSPQRETGKIGKRNVQTFVNIRFHPRFMSSERGNYSDENNAAIHLFCKIRIFLPGDISQFLSLREINPDIRLHVINDFIRDDRMVEVLEMARYDYVVDAIDTLAPKIFLIYHCLQKGLKVVSSMGAGGKMDPMQIRIADISKSYNCTLARMLRKRLHKLGVYKGVKVVFSPEEVDPEAVVLSESENKKSNVGTISYMPPLFGCYCASVVIRDLAGERETEPTE